MSDRERQEELLLRRRLAEREPSVAGAALGAGAGLLGGLLTLKSQRDILVQKQQEQGAAVAATRQAAADIGRNVTSAAATRGGALGLQQGLRAADGLQRQSLSAVQQANLQDQARADAFTGEQRQRQERLGAGIGTALGAAGATLGTAFTQGGAAGQAVRGGTESSVGKTVGNYAANIAAPTATGLPSSNAPQVQTGLSAPVEDALRGIGLGTAAQSPQEAAHLNSIATSVDPITGDALPTEKGKDPDVGDPNFLAEVLTGLPPERIQQDRNKQNVQAVDLMQKIGLSPMSTRVLIGSNLTTEELLKMLGEPGAKARLEAIATSIQGANPKVAY